MPVKGQSPYASIVRKSRQKYAYSYAISLTTLLIHLFDLNRRLKIKKRRTSSNVDRKITEEIDHLNQ